MQDVLRELGDLIQGYLPNVLAAVAILILGWLMALLLASMARSTANRLASRRLPDATDTIMKPPDIGILVGRVVFYSTLTFVVAGAFQALRLFSVSGPLDAMLQRFAAFMPQIFGAAALLGIGLVIAGGLRFATRRGLEVSDFGEKLAERAGLEAARPLARTVGDVVFWGTILLFVPAILGVLELEGLVAPLQSMFDDLLGVLPDLAGAALILLLGWGIARVIRTVVSGLLSSSGVDRFGATFGMGPDAGTRRLSSVIGLFVYALVLIPTAIAAFDTLRIDAVSGPATRMLEQVLTTIPLLFAAAVLLTIAYLVGRVLASLVSGVLGGIGFDQLFSRIGLTIGGGRTPSELAGSVILIALVLVAGIEAAGLLGLTALASLSERFFEFGARLLLSLVIFGVGLYLANLAYEVIPRGDGRLPTAYASAARIAIITLAGTMALQNTGVADRIVVLAFGLALGAVAVAGAIAFGLGSRDAARRVVEEAIGASSPPDTRSS